MIGSADDGGALAFYELSAAKRTLSPNYITTRPGFTQEYRGLELTLQRRLTARWQAVGSVTFGVQRENLGGTALTLLPVLPVITPSALPAGLPTPQDLDKTTGTRLDTSIPVVGKLMGSYHVPVPPVGERLLSVPGGLALHAHGQRGERARAGT